MRPVRIYINVVVINHVNFVLNQLLSTIENSGLLRCLRRSLKSVQLVNFIFKLTRINRVENIKDLYKNIK